MFNSWVDTCSCTHLDQVHNYSGEIDVTHNLNKIWIKLTNKNKTKYFSVHYKQKKPGLDQSSEELTTRHAKRNLKCQTTVLRYIHCIIESINKPSPSYNDNQLGNAASIYYSLKVITTVSSVRRKIWFQIVSWTIFRINMREVYVRKKPRLDLPSHRNV